VHGSGPPDASDELQVIAQRPPAPSGPSIKSYGVDLAAARAAGAGETTTRAILKARRRKLSKIVVAAVGACGGILIAAGVARMARGNEEKAGPAASASVSPPAVVASPAAVPAPAPSAPPADPTSSSGTLRLQKPAMPGHVWLDGNKITTTTFVAPCGQHQIKVGAHGKAHAIDLPCGSEMRVSR